MNRRSGPHHKIWTISSSALDGVQAAARCSHRRSDDGYTLVALLAVMSVIALLALAAAPSIQQQAQREREIETIYRGEQVADAIRLYYSAQVGRSRTGDTALPTSIDELLEGIPSGTKKVHVLRASAARDLLSDTGEWRLVRPRSKQMTEFTRDLMLYTENVRPATSDPQLQRVEQFMAPVVVTNLGLSSDDGLSIDFDEGSGPFIGVTSRSKSEAVIYYYGIGRHDHWVFTPLFR
jgi:type II secretory pathway pseudopilin PulG